jgi:hypothetical protein
MPGQFRSAAVLLGAAALVALQMPGPVHAAPVAWAATIPPAQAAVQVPLVLDPGTVTPPATVAASGACPTSSGIYEVVIAFNGGGVARASVDAETGGFGPVSFAVPEGTEPADYTVNAVVDGETGVCGSATLRVIPPAPQPTLVLRPGVVTAPGQVTASGTCPPDWSGDSVSLFLDGQQVATTTTDGQAQFGPVRVPVAAGTTPADHAVTSECGGSAWLTVSQPPATSTTPTSTTSTTTTPTTTTTATTPPTTTPTRTTTTAPTTTTTTPPTATTTTPTTGAPATTSSSVPAGQGPGGVPPVVPGAPSPSGPPPSGPAPTGPGRTGPGPSVPGQTSVAPSGPAQTGPASTAPGSAAPSETTGLPRPLWPVLGLLAGAALLATSVKGLRDRRGRQWVTEHIATRAAARQPLVPAPMPGETPHGHTVRLHLQREQGWTTPEEVADAHDRDHRTDDGA